MRSFSIKELENLSGVKSHTIRCWEQRYGAFHPKRNSNNVRMYSLEELTRLLLITRLNKSGYKISRLMKMGDEELHQYSNVLKTEEERQLRLIHQLIIAMYRINTDDFDGILDECFLSWNSGEVVKRILYPFLKLVDLLHSGRQLNEEHFVVTTMRSKLFWSIEKTERPKYHNKSIVLFLPDEKQLDLLLLFIHQVLKKEGWKVLYMGNNVSLQNLKELFKNRQPDFLLSYFPKKHSFDFDECSSFMKKHIPVSKLLVINTGVQHFSPDEFENITVLKGAGETLDYFSVEI